MTSGMGVPSLRLDKTFKAASVYHSPGPGSGR